MGFYPVALQYLPLAGGTINGSLAVNGAVTITAPLSPTTVNALTVYDNPTAPRTGAGQLLEIYDTISEPICSVPIAGGLAMFGDKLRAGEGVFGPFISLDGVNAAILFASGQRLWSGAGAPGTITNSSAGDIYFNQTGDGVSLHNMYVQSATLGTWVAVA
jgi:hypothetical protein